MTMHHHVLVINAVRKFPTIGNDAEITEEKGTYTNTCT